MVSTPRMITKTNFNRLAQTAFWNWTSARQNNTIRNEYMRAILRQEVAWFDQTKSGELTTRIVSYVYFPCIV